MHTERQLKWWRMLSDPPMILQYSHTPVRAIVAGISEYGYTARQAPLAV